MTKYFVTGGSGFIGTTLITQLIAQGHEVSALARSDASAEKIKSIDSSIEIIEGSLKDFQVITKAVKDSDGVLHLAHNFNDLQNANEIDSKVARVIGNVLEGSNKPFVYTTAIILYGTALNNDRKLITEDVHLDTKKLLFGKVRIETEQYVLSLKDKGIRAISIRLPLVHGENDPNFIRLLINAFKIKKFVGILKGGGENEWCAVNKVDVANLYILSAENGTAGSVYHAVAEERLKIKDLIESVSKGLNLPIKQLPIELMEINFGIAGVFITFNIPASSEKTQKELGWKPTGPSLLEDFQNYYYYY